MLSLTAVRTSLRIPTKPHGTRIQSLSTVTVDSNNPIKQVQVDTVVVSAHFQRPSICSDFLQFAPSYCHRQAYECFFFFLSHSRPSANFDHSCYTMSMNRPYRMRRCACCKSESRDSLQLLDANLLTMFRFLRPHQCLPPPFSPCPNTPNTCL
jgi:hypothetical protein